jgi:hypothetical protein
MNLGTFCPLEKHWHILTPIVPANLTQQAKSAAADGLTYSDSIDKKVGKI